MITEQMRNALVNFYEHMEPGQRADWYKDLPVLMAYQKLSAEEISYRTQLWSKYYKKVEIESPAAQLFREWQLWYQGKGQMTKEQLQDATKELKSSRLPDIAGRPSFHDPVLIKHLIYQAEQTAKLLLKREEQQRKKTRTWED